MSEQPATPLAAVPEWDAADRMRKALRTAGMSVQEIAAYLGVSRTSVSNWINGRVEPDTRTYRLWALRTGVSYEWLAGQDGTGARPGPGTRTLRPRSAAPRQRTRGLSSYFPVTVLGVAA